MKILFVDDGGLTFATLDLPISVRFAQPDSSCITDLTFRSVDMAALMGKPVFDPATPPAGVAHRNVSITLNGGAPVVTDFIDPATEFSCNDGDQIVATNTEVKDDGTSLTPSAPFTVTASVAPPPGGGVPGGTSSSITNMTFRTA